MLGILAEDDTDVETLKVLARRILPAIKGKTPPIHAWGANGSGEILRQGAARLTYLAAKGCTKIVIVHDLDRNRANDLNDETALRARLDAIDFPAGAVKLICIPIEEIEAWFFSDPAVLKKYDAEGSASKTPHGIANPKEALIRLSRAKNKKPRYSTNDNPALAEILNLTLCAERCRAFKQFRDFIS